MIIFLNGSINAGKSTVARLLAKRIPRPAVVEVDSLHAFIEWVDIDACGTLNLENAVAVIRNFVREKFNVVVPCPILDADYKYLVDRLKDADPDIHAFTLRPSIEKARTSTPQRTLTQWELGRIALHYSSGLVDPKFGAVLDTTTLGPEETAEWILKRLPGPKN